MHNRSKDRLDSDWDQHQSETYSCTKLGDRKVHVCLHAVSKHANMETRPLGKKCNKQQRITHAGHTTTGCPGPYTAVGGGGGGQGGSAPPPLPEKTIFTIFRMSLLIILWIFGTFSAYRPYCPPGENILRTALRVSLKNWTLFDFM